MAKKKATKKISGEEFDRRFDDGEDVSDYIDFNAGKRPDLEVRRVNVDFPAWMIDCLDERARKLGVNRQAIIKTLLASHFEASK